MDFDFASFRSVTLGCPAFLGKAEGDKGGKP